MGLLCEPWDQDSRVLPDIRHYSSAVSSGGQSHTWRMAAMTNGRQEVANLTDIWEVDFFFSLPSAWDADRLSHTPATTANKWMNACTAASFGLMTGWANDMFCCLADVGSVMAKRSESWCWSKEPHSGFWSSNDVMMKVKVWSWTTFVVSRYWSWWRCSIWQTDTKRSVQAARNQSAADPTQKLQMCPIKDVAAL